MIRYLADASRHQRLRRAARLEGVGLRDRAALFGCFVEDERPRGGGWGGGASSTSINRSSRPPFPILYPGPSPGLKGVVWLLQPLPSTSHTVPGETHLALRTFLIPASACSFLLSFRHFFHHVSVMVPSFSTNISFPSFY